MSRLSNNDRKWLEKKFGARANFNPTERFLYGHDIAAIPSLFKLIVGRTIPDVVVQPENEEELAALVKWTAGAGKASRRAASSVRSVDSCSR